MFRRGGWRTRMGYKKLVDFGDIYPNRDDDNDSLNNNSNSNGNKKQKKKRVKGKRLNIEKMGFFNRILGKKANNNTEDSPTLPSSSPSSPSSLYDQESDYSRDHNAQSAGKKAQDIDNASTATTTNSKDHYNPDPAPPKLVADRVRRIVHYYDDSCLSPDDRFWCSTTYPSMTSLCSSGSGSGSNSSNTGSSSSQSPNPQNSPTIGQYVHWPLTEIRQLPNIILPCVHYGMTACELGNFMVKTLYRRDRYLGNAVTQLVDVGSTYALIGRSIVKYFGLLNDKDSFLSDDLATGDPDIRPMRSDDPPKDFTSYRSEQRNRGKRPIAIPVAAAAAAAAARSQPTHVWGEYLRPQAARAPVQIMHQAQQNQTQTQNQDFIDCRSPRPKRGHAEVHVPVHTSTSSHHHHHHHHHQMQQQNRRSGDVMPHSSPTVSPRLPRPRWPFIGYDIGLGDDIPDKTPYTNNRHSLGTSLDLGISPVDSVHPSSPGPSAERQQQQQTSEPVAPVYRAGYDANERRRKRKGVHGIPPSPQTVSGPSHSGPSGEFQSPSTHERKIRSVHDMLNVRPWGFLDEHRRRLDKNGEH